MRGIELTVTDVKLVTENCIECGTIYAMLAAFYEQRKKTRKDFFCPAGHKQAFTEDLVQKYMDKAKFAEESAAALQREIDAVGAKLQRVEKMKVRAAKARLRRARMKAKAAP